MYVLIFSHCCLKSVYMEITEEQQFYFPVCVCVRARAHGLLPMFIMVCLQDKPEPPPERLSSWRHPRIWPPQLGVLHPDRIGWQGHWCSFWWSHPGVHVLCLAPSLYAYCRYKECWQSFQNNAILCCEKHKFLSYPVCYPFLLLEEPTVLTKH